MVSANAATRWAEPAWTLPMYQPSTGMDHLGLASVSQDRILPALSPGVNVLTVHPRYWSVYSWLLTEFWDRQLPRTQAAWGLFLKPRERIFVAAVLSCPRHGTDIPEVAGKRTVGAEVDREDTEFDPTAPYLKNARGGYPIYASAVSQLGLTLLDRDTSQFSCDAPTEAGRALGHSLRAWIEPTRYYAHHFNAVDVAVPADVVAEYAERVCLCRLVDGPDLPHVEDAFLHGGDPGQAERRRSSLRLVCDVSAQTKAEPVDSWDFRKLIYYGRDYRGRSYTPSTAELQATWRRWRLYQLRELQAWACNRWLRWISRWGLASGGDRAPIPLADVLATADDSDFAVLAASLNLDDPELASGDPLDALLEWVRSAAAIDGDLDDPWDVDAEGCEDGFFDHLWDLDRDGTDIPAGVLALLVSCALRVWPLEYQLRYAGDWPLVAAGGARRLGVARTVEDLRSHLKAEATIGSTGRWFLEHYVIRQHHRVALGKLPDDTFRLRLDAGRVWFRDEQVAVEVNDSRFRALSTCAAELGWTRPLAEPAHGLTRRGRQLVKGGDLAGEHARSAPSA